MRERERGALGLGCRVEPPGLHLGRARELDRAVVALNRAAHTSVDELGDWVVARLARYKRPRRIVFTDEVVRTSVGKPDYPWALAQVTS